MDLSAETKPAIEMLIKAITSVSYIFDSHICDLENVHEAGGKKELLESIDLLPYDSPYNVKRQSGPENLTHDVFGTSDMNAFWKMAKKMLNPMAKVV